MSQVPYLIGMTLHPLQSRSRRSRDSALDYEIVQEQAAALGRLGRKLEVALAALSAHDRAQAKRGDHVAALTSSAKAVRKRLVRAAGYALWCFIIQREACGLRDQRQVLSAYEVPGEVWNRMGVFGSD